MTKPFSPEDIAAIFDLNARQARFVWAYLGPASYYASRAAVMAGYSAKHPRQTGHQIMRSKRVKDAVQRLSEHYWAGELAALLAKA